MKHTIMTEKIARKGIKIPSEYEADFLDLVTVKNCAVYNVVTINGDDTIENIRKWFSKGAPESLYNGYPVVDKENKLLGIISRREILNPVVPPNKRAAEIISRPLKVIYPDNTLKDAVNLMAEAELSRLPVVERKNPHNIVALVSRSDILKQRRENLKKKYQYERSLNFYRFTKNHRQQEKTTR